MENNRYSVWKDLNFIWLWIGTTLSAFGDSAFFILLGWFVIDVTKSDLALGTALICSSIPRVLFMLFGGVAADRMSKKTILISSLLTRTIVLGLFGLYLWLPHHGATMDVVYIMAIIFGIVDAFFWPANQSMVPSIVPKSAIGSANSIIQTSQTLSMVVGPLAASVLLLLKSYPIMFISVTVCFVAGILMLAQLKSNRLLPIENGDIQWDGEAIPDMAAAATGKTSPFRDVVAGIQYVLGIRILTFIMVVSLVVNLLFMGPVNIGLPTMVKQLHWSGSDYGYLEAAIGIGGILGGILVGLLKNLRGHFTWLAGAGFVFGFAFSFVGWIHFLPIQLGLMGLVGICMSLLNIPMLTYVHTISDTKMIGRVMSLLTLMSQGLIPVSYAVSSFILQLGIVSVIQLIIISGTVMGAFSLTWLLMKEFRIMEENPAWRNVLDSGHHATFSGDPVS